MKTKKKVQTLGFCRKTSLHGAIGHLNGIVNLRYKIEVILVKGNIISAVKRRPDVTTLLPGVKRFLVTEMLCNTGAEK